jgi:hypothetical protein
MSRRRWERATLCGWPIPSDVVSMTGSQECSHCGAGFISEWSWSGSPSWTRSRSEYDRSYSRSEEPDEPET